MNGRDSSPGILCWTYREIPTPTATTTPINTVDPTGLIGFEIGPVKVGDGCPLGKNVNGTCRGSGVAREVATNPVVQTAVVAAGCTAGPGGCAAANIAVVGVNSYYRYRDEGGVTASWAMGTALDVVLTRIPMRHAARQHAIWAKVHPSTGSVVTWTFIGGGRGIPRQLYGQLFKGNLWRAGVSTGLSLAGNATIEEWC